jgi:hypothetical protein
MISPAPSTLSPSSLAGALRVVGPGEFVGPTSISLPLGSVLVLASNGADVAKHCVSAAHAKRISITFRKMDAAKLLVDFRPDSDLQNLAHLGSARRSRWRQHARVHPQLSVGAQQRCTCASALLF